MNAACQRRLSVHHFGHVCHRFDSVGVVNSSTAPLWKQGTDLDLVEGAGLQSRGCWPQSLAQYLRRETNLQVAIF